MLCKNFCGTISFIFSQLLHMPFKIFASHKIQQKLYSVFVYLPKEDHSFHCTQNHNMCICWPSITTSLVNLFPLEYKICEIRNLHSNIKKKICLKIKNLIGMFCCIFWFLVCETLLHNLHLKPQTDFIPCHLQLHREHAHL